MHDQTAIKIAFKTRIPQFVICESLELMALFPSVFVFLCGHDSFI